MPLNEILEHHSLKEINQRTNISEESLEALRESDFEILQRAKSLGFVSILEREYKVDLGALKEEINRYYQEHQHNDRITLNVPPAEKEKGQSKLFMLIVLCLIIFASWYFITQFNHNQLAGWLPSVQEKFSALGFTSDSNVTIAPQSVMENTSFAQ